MQMKHRQAKRPPITIIDSEADVLSDLALKTQARAPEVSNLLLQELERAKPCSREKMPPGVVTMMSQVEFIDEGTGAHHQIQLVFPRDADAETRRISILTPIGAGLIGLRTGQVISWPNRTGEFRRLKVVRVTRPEDL